MRKVFIIIISFCITILIMLGLYFLPISRSINNTIDGYVVYQDDSELSCNVTIEGNYRDFLFRQMDTFDGTIEINEVSLGISRFGIPLSDTGGFTSYSIHRFENNILKLEGSGDLLLNQSCETAIISCCFDSVSNSITADERYRCLVVAPANTSGDANNVIASFKSSGYLNRFKTWKFD